MMGMMEGSDLMGMKVGKGMKYKYIDMFIEDKMKMMEQCMLMMEDMMS